MPISFNARNERSTARRIPPYRKTVLRFFLLSLLFGLASFRYLLLLPFAAAFFAALFLFENPKGRRFSYIGAAVLIAAEIAITAFGARFSCLSPLVLFPAFLLTFAFRKEWNRRDTAVVSIALITVLLALSLYLDGAGAAGAYHPRVVYDYYTDLMRRAEDTFVNTMLDVLHENPTIREEYASLLSEEKIRESVTRLESYAFSVIVWVAMAFSCLATRIFARVAHHVTGMDRHPFFTDFLLTSLTAYLFFALACLAALSPTATTVGAEIVNNLFFLLVLPFAYIGAKGLFSILDRANRPFLKVLCVAALVFFNVFALRLLAYFGAFANIMFNRAVNDLTGKTD